MAKAIIEMGRINKTLYLLNYIDNEDYWRRILTQLNRGEGRHAVARAICYGQCGESENAIAKAGRSVRRTGAGDQCPGAMEHHLYASIGGSPQTTGAILQR